MPKNRIAIFVIASVLLFAGCSTRPSYVLSEKKMENILYDLYLADVVKDDNYMVFANDSARRQGLINSVFARHKVTKQEFDTSLYWYAGNLDRYDRIVDRITVRYNATADELRKELDATVKKSGENRNNLVDTAWFTLHTPGFLQNRYVFNLQNPTKLSREKYFTISFDALGISDAKPELYLRFFARDTIIKYQETIDMNGPFDKSFKIPDHIQANRVYGYIEVPDTVQAFILLRDFALSADSSQLTTSGRRLSINERQTINEPQHRNHSKNN